MKKIIIIITMITFASFTYGQKFLTNGVVPKNSFLVGAETGFSLTHIEKEYSLTGDDVWLYSIRMVPKISYSPFKNFMLGAYYEYEKASSPSFPKHVNYGYGGFTRLYLPQINNIFKLNRGKFLSTRILFFSEVYFEKNNFIYDENTGTEISDELNTIFYGLKLGVNFRIINSLYFELAEVKNFDNQGGNFAFLHPELGLEYIFNHYCPIKI